jgi:hypothetical protein
MGFGENKRKNGSIEREESRNISLFITLIVDSNKQM